MPCLLVQRENRLELYICCQLSLTTPQINYIWGKNSLSFACVARLLCTESALLEFFVTQKADIWRHIAYVLLERVLLKFVATKRMKFSETLKKLRVFSSQKKYLKGVSATNLNFKWPNGVLYKCDSVSWSNFDAIYEIGIAKGKMVLLHWLPENLFHVAESNKFWSGEASRLSFRYYKGKSKRFGGCCWIWCEMEAS